MQTVIAAFDDRQDAERALARLMESGFSRDRIQLRAQYESLGDRSDGSSPVTSRESHGTLESIGHFFSELFGSEAPDGEASRYAEAVRRGGSVIVVDAADNREADQARAALGTVGGTGREAAPQDSVRVVQRAADRR